MRFPFRRHRGSQTGDLAPVVRISSFPEGVDPAEIARVFSRALDGRRPPERRTARQVLTASLRNADFLAEGHVQALADGILLDLGEAGLEIVVKEDPDEATPQIPALDATLAVMGISKHEATDGLRERARRDLGITSLAEAENTPHPYRPNPVDPPRSRWCLVCCGTAAHWTHEGSE